jgi:uncharacterized membrane-anchored protein YjiN (DUF445 family)
LRQIIFFNTKTRAKMKQRIIDALKPLVANKGLKQKELDNLAEQIIAIKGITAESTDADIESAVQDGVIIAAYAQSIGNRMDTEATARVTKRYEGFVDPKTLEPQNPQPQGGQGGDAIQQPQEPQNNNALSQKQIQKLIADAVSSAIAPFRAKEEASRLASLLAADKRIEKVPAEFRAHYTLDKEENLDALAEKINSEYAAMRRSVYLADGIAEPPAIASGAQGGAKPSQTPLLDMLHNTNAQQATK